MPNPLSRRLRRQWLPQVVSVILVAAQLQAAGQQAAPPQATPQATPPAPSPAAAPAPPQPIPAAQLPVEQSLKIQVLAGNNEMNDLQRHVMAPLVVQVEDQNDRPMDGAQVVFRFPINGPSATFGGGKPTATVRTNSGGQAAATNWMANGEVGTFEVHVNATYGNQIGEATLHMTNVTRIEEVKKVSRTKSLWSHRWVKIAVIGGVALAVGLGVYLGTRGGGKSGNTVGVAPGGGVTVSGP
jgi:hypothetical protein